jgi:RimJ/RimL family protein N-acetyltransferase
MFEIETARLRLRPFTLDDAEIYYRTLLSDPDVMRYLPGGAPRPRDHADRAVDYFTDHWARHGFGISAVILKSESRLIGQCGLQYIPDLPHVEVAYALGRVYWGQGLASEAARAWLRCGFEELNLDRIVALFLPGNTASERVMIKLGMTYQGTLHAYDTDLPCYAIARADFRPDDTPTTEDPC